MYADGNFVSHWNHCVEVCRMAGLDAVPLAALVAFVGASLFALGFCLGRWSV